MRRRRALLAASTVLGITLAAGTAWTLASSDRRSDPVALVDSATAALRAARAAGAGSQAPVNLILSEGAYQDGLTERRRQELRLGMLRDYRAARSALTEALQRAESARTVSTRLEDKERALGTREIQRARATLATLDGVEARVWVATDTRRRLQRARALVSEGASLVAAGEYRTGALRAGEGHREAVAVAEGLQRVTARYADAANLTRWQGWAAETVAWSRGTGRPAIVVDKDAHLLTLYENGRAVRTLDVELGWNNTADKRIQGDGATPEGRYRVTEMKGRGRSRYYKALLLDYPNEDDLKNLAALHRAGAVPRGTRAGGLIEIHGEGSRGKDWTDGCVAVDNAGMDELFRRVQVGTPVTIVGSHRGQGVFAEVARSLAR